MTLPARPEARSLKPEAHSREILFTQAGFLGIVVSVVWAGNSWWIARVQSRNGDVYHVAYGDGTDGDVAVRDLVPIPSNPTLKVGDHVIACWKGPRMFPGKVVASGPAGFTVQWDDGDTPSVVPAGKIAPF